jgi:hypothetical protein
MRKAEYKSMALVMVIAATGYCVRVWQDRPIVQDLRDKLIAQSYGNYANFGRDDSGAPFRWWESNKEWKKRIDADLALPYKWDATLSDKANEFNEDKWGTAYLIVHQGTIKGSDSLICNKQMSEAEQDARIRFLCFLARKRMYVMLAGGYFLNEAGSGSSLQDLDSYPLAALDRNVQIVQPVLSKALAVQFKNRHEASAIMFVRDTISLPWVQDIAFKQFCEGVEEGNYRGCEEFWCELWDAAASGRDRTNFHKHNPIRPGAAAVIKRIQELRRKHWDDSDPSSEPGRWAIAAFLKQSRPVPTPLTTTTSTAPATSASSEPATDPAK